MWCASHSGISRQSAEQEACLDCIICDASSVLNCSENALYHCTSLKSKFFAGPMHFCPLCGNLLVPEQHQSTQLGCTACPYSYKLSTVLTSTQKLKVKSIDGIFGGDDELKYASKCEAKCPKCAHSEALFLEVQTRSADEPMTIFYQCTRCRFDWRE